MNLCLSSSAYFTIEIGKGSNKMKKLFEYNQKLKAAMKCMIQWECGLQLNKKRDSDKINDVRI